MAAVTVVLLGYLRQVLQQLRRCLRLQNLSKAFESPAKFEVQFLSHNVQAEMGKGRNL